MEPIIARIEALILPILAPENIELVDLTYQKEGPDWVLRVFLDKSGGFNSGDCETWGEKISLLLDEHAIIDHGYNLEISSPGIYRALKKTADYQRFIGERVRIKLYAPVDGTRNISGVLKGFEHEQVVVLLETQKELRLSLNQIAKANLDPVLKF